MAAGDADPLDPDLRRARGLPATAYTDPAALRAQLERFFVPAWHLVGDAAAVAEAGAVAPAVVLEGSLDEPVALVRDEGGTLRCLANVCTHRGNAVVSRAGHAAGLRCRYHGRRFALDGRCLAMPGFAGVEGFPAPQDDLSTLPVGRWGPLVFASLAPAAPLEQVLGEVRRRLAFMEGRPFVFDAARSRDYEVRAHWALYCENYLEGFHIPFVHEGLAGALDWSRYRTEVSEHGVLQVGVGADDDALLALPADHPEHGQRIAALYFFVFPNLMINAYPWGLSVNVVEPLAVDRTRVRFATWVADAALLDAGAGAGLHAVELEDEEVVESVQRGVRSRFFRRARFSPEHEQGVHWLHRKLAG